MERNLNTYWIMFECLPYNWCEYLLDEWRPWFGDTMPREEPAEGGRWMGLF